MLVLYILIFTTARFLVMRLSLMGPWLATPGMTHSETRSRKGCNRIGKPWKTSERVCKMLLIKTRLEWVCNHHEHQHLFSVYSWSMFKTFVQAGCFSKSFQFFIHRFIVNATVRAFHFNEENSEKYIPSKGYWADVIDIVASLWIFTGSLGDTLLFFWGSHWTTRTTLRSTSAAMHLPTFDFSPRLHRSIQPGRTNGRPGKRSSWGCV